MIFLFCFFIKKNKAGGGGKKRGGGGGGDENTKTMRNETEHLKMVTI